MSYALKNVEEYLDIILFQPERIEKNRHRLKPYSGEIIYTAQKEYLGEIAHITFIIRDNQPKLIGHSKTLKSNKNGTQAGNSSATENL